MRPSSTFPNLRAAALATALLISAGAAFATLDTSPEAEPEADVPTEPALPAAAETEAVPAPLFLDNPPATCTADCLYGPDVSCSGDTCSSADDPGGYVVCDGRPKLCPRPPL